MFNNSNLLPEVAILVMALTVVLPSPFIIRRQSCGYSVHQLSLPELLVIPGRIQSLPSRSLQVDTEIYLQFAASCVSQEEVNYPYPKLFVSCKRQPSLAFGVKRNRVSESGCLRNRLNCRLEIRFIVEASIPGGGAENVKHH